MPFEPSDDSLSHYLLDYEAEANSETFQEFVAYAVSVGALERGDILVVNNRAIHFRGENGFLDDVLYKQIGVLMIPLPAYAPEINPILKVFKSLTKRLKPMANQRIFHDNRSFISAVHQILNRISAKEVREYYMQCGYHKV